MGYVKTQGKVLKCASHWFDYGIMLCLMSFTHGWVVTNHPVLSGPEILVSPSLSPSTPLVSLSSLFLIRRIWQSVARQSSNGNQWRVLFEKLFVFLPLFFFSISTYTSPRYPFLCSPLALLLLSPRRPSMSSPLSPQPALHSSSQSFSPITHSTRKVEWGQWSERAK